MSVQFSTFQDVYRIKNIPFDNGRDTAFSDLLQTRRVRDGDQFQKLFITEQLFAFDARIMPQVGKKRVQESEVNRSCL